MAVDDGPGLDLINSENWFRRGPKRDRLLNEPEWVDDFLGRWGFEIDTPLASKQRRELLQLRATLRVLSDAVVAREPLPPAALAKFNNILGGAPVQRRFRGENGTFVVEHEPVRPGWAGVIGEIAASFAQLLAEGQPERLKRCENPDCGWLFYDRGKNLRRRWCHPAICGNRDKVRRYRARQ
jgi:predicted RNA-binding Zn ribbon-like protein